LEGRSIGSKALFIAKNLIAQHESCPFIPKMNFDAFALPNRGRALGAPILTG